MYFFKESPQLPSTIKISNTISIALSCKVLCAYICTQMHAHTQTHTLVTLYLSIFLITGLSISSSGSQYEGMRIKGGKLNGNRTLHQSLENIIFKGKLPKDYWHRNTSRFYYSSFDCEKRVTALRSWWIPRGTSEKQCQMALEEIIAVILI